MKVREATGETEGMIDMNVMIDVMTGEAEEIEEVVETEGVVVAETEEINLRISRCADLRIGRLASVHIIKLN